ncbi:C3HC4 type (RING finger) and transmembrane domain-containing protein [Hexamita inflata]|uniref:C3HC4 type (RING finger) and transmembrane domain-containing protein n=1 Tax=Hexamita inflata TaxID=28002 RepID=A0AA86NSX4_9EUKA|nr:C3HC4 type (RING finger) and transmembrane domain-containing protein [Hexamita inflata]
MIHCLLAFQYSHQKPSYPNYIDTYDLDASVWFDNITSNIVGSRKLLNLKNTPKNAMTSIGISISDNSWNETYYNKTINTPQPPRHLTRNITVSLTLSDGNYTSSPQKSWQCEGKFFPLQQRGMGDCIYYTGFSSPEFKSNETELEAQALDALQFWPNATQWNVDPSINGDDKKLKKCKTQVYFTLSQSLRQISKKNNYPPDTNLRRAWRAEAQAFNDTHENVPTASIQFVSLDCGFQVNMTNVQIKNYARSQLNGLIFYAVIVISQIIMASASIKFTIDTNSSARVKQLNFIALSFHMNSEYLVCILYITSTSFVGGLLNIQSFLSFITIGSLFPMIIRTVLMIYVNNQQNDNQGMGKMIIKILLLVLSTVGPAVLILLLAYFIPILATFVLVLLTCSFMFVTSVAKFIKGDGKPAFPLYFIFANLLNKCLLLSYIFGMLNAYNLEHHISWLIACNALMGGQLVLYLLQFALGPRFGVKVRNKNVYNYQQNIPLKLVQQMTCSKTKQKETDVLISFQKPIYNNTAESIQENKEARHICCNPLHNHGNAQRNASFSLHALEEIPECKAKLEQMPPTLKAFSNYENLTNCLTYINLSSMEEFACPICFDQLQLVNSSQGEHTRIFNQINQKLYKYESAHLKAGDYTGENIWVTPCGHAFHEGCLRKWMAENVQCPVDRVQLKVPEE